MEGGGLVCVMILCSPESSLAPPPIYIAGPSSQSRRNVEGCGDFAGAVGPVFVQALHEW